MEWPHPHFNGVTECASMARSASHRSFVVASSLGKYPFVLIILRGHALDSARRALGIRVPELCLFAYCRGGHTTAVAEYPDNVEPNTQISKAPAPFWLMRMLAESFVKRRDTTNVKLRGLRLRSPQRLNEPLRLSPINK